MKNITLNFISFFTVFLTAGIVLASGSPVGKVTEVVKNVTITAEDGSKRTAIKDAPVFLNDVVKTGSDSKIKIFFNNENIVILGFNSELKITEFVHDPESGKSRNIFELIMGKVRAIVKKLKPKSQFKIKVANSDIGVLGTDFAVLFDPVKRVIETFVDEGTVIISDVENRWTALDLQENHYTRIEGDGEPDPPVEYDPGDFKPIKEELTVYEEPEPSAQSDYDEYIEQYSAEAEGENSAEEEEILEPEIQEPVSPIPEEGQEPLTGTVKVKVTTVFP
jgi:hypothetical protein